MRSIIRFVFIVATLAVVILALAVRLHALMSRAGDRRPYQNAPGSLVRDIADLGARTPAAAPFVRELALASQLLPDAAPVSALETAVREQADRSGVVIVNIEQMEDQSAGSAGVRQKKFRIRCGGSYDQIAFFVNRLEGFGLDAARRLFLIDSLAVVGDGNPRHTAELVVRGFSYDGSLPGSLRLTQARGEGLVDVVSGQTFIYEGGGRDPMLPAETALPQQQTRARQDADKTPAQPSGSATPAAGAVAAPPAVAPVVPPPEAEVKPTTPLPLSNEKDALPAAHAVSPAAAENGSAAQSQSGKENEVGGKSAEKAGGNKDEVCILEEEIATLKREMAETAGPGSDIARQVEISGISWSPDSSRVFVNDRVAGIGDVIALPGGETVSVVAIAKDSVEFEHAGRRFTKYLRLFSETK